MVELDIEILFILKKMLDIRSFDVYNHQDMRSDPQNNPNITRLDSVLASIPIKRISSTRKKSDPNTHYIDNVKFNEACVEYANAYRKAKAEGTEIPQVSNYLGKCFILLAENIGRKANFRNYTFLPDMISDAIDNCLTAIRSFDPERSQNPFGFLTLCIHRAFLRRIATEKQALYRKFKTQINALNFHQTYTMGIDGDRIDLDQSDMDYINDYIRDYESKMAENKLKKKMKLQEAQEDMEE